MAGQSRHLRDTASSAILALGGLALAFTMIEAFARHREAAMAGQPLAPVQLPLMRVRETGADFDVHMPQAWLRVWAREAGVPYLDLLPSLREHARSTGEDLYVSGNIHWNERGHALAGALTRDWFRREVYPLGLPAGRPRVDDRPAEEGMVRAR